MVVNGGPYTSFVVPYLFNHVDVTTPSDMAAGKAVLICRPNSHPFVDRTLSLEQPVKIGRSVARARAAQGNGIFDCKVLSRNHALIWYNNGKFFLQDTKSSNGTFVNNQRLSKSGEESLPREVSSGDIVQFGVDVLENARKVTHGCIVANLKLYLPDGKEAKASPSTSVLSGAGSASIEELYQLNQHIQEALQREQTLQAKLATLSELATELRHTAELSWKALIAEDRLISRIEMLENQLQTYSKNFPEEKLRDELKKLQEDKILYQGLAKECLQKVLQEKLEAVQKCMDMEKDLQNAEIECLNFKTAMQQDQEEIRELAHKHNLQIIKTIELQMKYEQLETTHKEEMAKLEAENEEIRNEVKMLLANEAVLQEKIQTLQSSGALVGRQLLGIQSQFGLNQTGDIHNHLSSLKRNGSTADVICKNDDEELKEEKNKDDSNIDSLLTQLMNSVEKQKNAKEVFELIQAQVSLLQNEKMTKLQTINSLEGELEMNVDQLYSLKEEKKKLENSLETVEETLKEQLQSKKDNDTTKMNGNSERILNGGPFEAVVESLTEEVNNLKELLKDSKSKVEGVERTITLQQAELDNTKKNLSEDTKNWLLQHEKLQEAQCLKEETDIAVNTLREQFKTLEDSMLQMKLKEKSDEDPEHNVHKEANTCTLLRKQLQEAQQLAKQNKNEAELVRERLREVQDELHTLMSKMDPSYSPPVVTPPPTPASFPALPPLDNKSIEEMAQTFQSQIVLLESQIKMLREECNHKEQQLESSKEKDVIIQKLRSRVSEMEEELVLVKEKFMSCNEKNTQLEKELVDLRQDYDNVVHQPYFNVVFMLPLLVLFIAMTIAFHPTLSRLMGTSDVVPSLPELADPSADNPDPLDS